jgi:hypothetical protein
MSKKNTVEKMPRENPEDEVSHKILMRQIREEARKENIQRLLVKYQKQITSIVVISLVIIVSLFIYNTGQKSNSEKYSKLIHQYLIFENSNKVEAGNKILEEIRNSKSAPQHIKALSLLKYGSNLVSQNKITQGVEVYLEANNLKNADPYIRDLAGLLAVKSMIDHGDNKFKGKIKDLLLDLENSSSSLKSSILEQKAIFAWSIGDMKQAHEIFQNLSLDLEAPAHLKKRAKEFERILNRLL